MPAPSSPIETATYWPGGTSRRRAASSPHSMLRVVIVTVAPTVLASRAFSARARSALSKGAGSVRTGQSSAASSVRSSMPASRFAKSGRRSAIWLLRSIGRLWRYWLREKASSFSMQLGGELGAQLDAREPFRQIRQAIGNLVVEIDRPALEILVAREGQQLLDAARRRARCAARCPRAVSPNPAGDRQSGC